jgi:hypothetical protein
MAKIDSACDFSTPFHCTVSQERALIGVPSVTFGGPKRVCVLPVQKPGDAGCVVTSAGQCAINGGVFVADRNQCPGDSFDFQTAYNPVSTVDRNNSFQFFTTEGITTSLATLGSTSMRR